MMISIFKFYYFLWYLYDAKIENKTIPNLLYFSAKSGDISFVISFRGGRLKTSAYVSQNTQSLNDVFFRVADTKQTGVRQQNGSLPSRDCDYFEAVNNSKEKFLFPSPSAYLFFFNQAYNSRLLYIAAPRRWLTSLLFVVSQRESE